jgi:hypothetical protein
MASDIILTDPMANPAETLRIISVVLEQTDRNAADDLVLNIMPSPIGEQQKARSNRW